MTVDDIAKLLARAGTIYFVGAGGNDANDGLTWATRKLTVGSAVTIATDGDTVLIGKGTYPERLIANKRINYVGAGTEDTTGTVITGSGTSPTVAGRAGSTYENLQVHPGAAELLTFQSNARVKLTKVLLVNLQAGGLAFQSAGTNQDRIEDSIIQGNVDCDGSNTQALRTIFTGVVGGDLTCFDCFPNSLNANATTNVTNNTSVISVGANIPGNGVGAELKLARWENETKTFIFQVKDSAGVVITGWNAQDLVFIEHTNAEPPVEMVNISYLDGIVVTGTLSDTIEVTVNSGVVGKYSWELWNGSQVILHGSDTVLKTTKL